MPKFISKIILVVLLVTGAISFGAINQLDLHPSVQIYLLLLVVQSLVAAVIFWRKKSSD